MANYVFDLQRGNSVDFDTLYPKTIWEQVLGKPSTYTPTSHVHSGLIFYLVGNTTGTAGTWTASHADISDYYDGLTVAFKIGIDGAGTTTLNVNGLGAKTVRRNTGALTTHLPINSVVILTLTTISAVQYWVWSDYDSDSNYDLRTTGYYINGEDAVYTYKIVMEGSNGKFYPLTLENTTGLTKTVSTRNFKVNGKMLYSVTGVSANTLTRYYWYDRANNRSDYTFNQSTWASQGYPIYLVAILQSDGSIKLDNTSATSFFTQILPTTADGKLYIHVGYAHDNTNLNFDISHPIYQYVDGKIRIYTPAHTLDEIADTANYVKVTPAEKTAWNSSGSSLVLGELATNAYYGDKGKTAYDHSQVAHAPSNAQKNSDITKAEIEAKLIGAITTHTHAYEPILSAGTSAQYYRGDKTWQPFPSSLPASDVYSWAKAPTKPAYTYDEVGASSEDHDHAGSYEPVINAGTTAQYWRGDKTWQTFPTLPTNTQLLNADPLRKSGNNIMLYNASGTYDSISLLDFYTYSLAGNGYTKLPNGMIIQYGTQACNGSSSYSVTLPIAFSTTNYRVACSALTTSIQGNTTVTAKGGANSASVMVLYAQYITPTSGGYAGSDTTIHWIAIGY